jgi:hypothetical protein
MFKKFELLKTVLYQVQHLRREDHFFQDCGNGVLAQALSVDIEANEEGWGRPVIGYLPSRQAWPVQQPGKQNGVVDEMMLLTSWKR